MLGLSMLWNFVLIKEEITTLSFSTDYGMESGPQEFILKDRWISKNWRFANIMVCMRPITETMTIATAPLKDFFLLWASSYQYIEELVRYLQCTICDIHLSLSLTHTYTHTHIYIYICYSVGIDSSDMSICYGTFFKAEDIFMSRIKYNRRVVKEITCHYSC